MAGFYTLNCIDELGGFLKMKFRTIKDIGQVVSGSTPSRDNPEFWGGSIPWVTPKELSALSSPFLNDSVEKITELGYKSCSATMLPKGSVLFSSRAPIGLVAVATLPVCTNQGFKSIVPNDDVDALYLYYALKHHKRQLNALGTGTTFKELSKSTFEKFALPFPENLQTQRQIAHLLSRAEELIATRQRSLALLDEFLKSTFLELFGDPVKNEKGWEVEKLTKSGSEVKIGPFGSLLHAEDYVENGTPLINPMHIINGSIEADSRFSVSPEKAKSLKAYHLKTNDIIMGRRGEMGRCALVYEKQNGWICGTGSLIIRPSIQFNSYFLLHWLSSPQGKSLIQSQAKGGTMLNLNQTVISNLPVSIPPLPLQTHFAEIVNHVETLKMRQRESLAQLQTLYQSLLQRAFSGQLDVSGVRLPGEELPYLLRRPTSRTLSTRKTKLRSAARHRAEDTVTETDLPPTVAPSQTPPLMKLLSLTLHESFRSLPAGFHIPFMPADTPVEELTFAPYCLVGRNGSGKSNVLEALAAIFYHIDCIYLTSKPDGFERTEEQPNRGFDATQCQPDAFALSYLIRAPYFATAQDANPLWHIQIRKERGSRPVVTGYSRETDTPTNARELTRVEVPKILPDLVVGYSSGENEVLSLPFFKMRFLHFDEYLTRLSEQTGYIKPEGRLVYLDKQFSEAILLANFLVQPEEVMQPVYKLIGIEGIDRFELTIRQDLHVPKAPLKKTLMVYDDLLRARSASDEGKSFELTSLAIEWIDKLHRCATAIEDRHKKAGASPGLTLKFSIDEEARRKFRHEFANDPLELFRVFQILLTLNLFDVDVRTKQYIYRSSSLYVGESVPALAHFQRVSNFNDVMLWKIGIDGVPHKIPLRALSDGEFQLLHSLGICLLLKDTNALFLLDEPETHFNPDWRARFISTLQACLQTNGTTESGSEMLITTHSPFLVSDTPRDNVLIFKAGQTEPNRPDFQSYGASADDITMQIFEREQTIGEGVYALLNEWRAEPIHSHADIERLRANTAQIGDSVEKIMFLNYLREQSKKLPVQSML